MRGPGARVGTMVAAALVPAACLSLSEVEGAESDAALGGSAGTGGIASDVWHVEEASGGSAGSAGGDAGPPAFGARGVVFDGLGDWLERAGQFSGTTDTTIVSGSVWFKRVGLGQSYCVGPEAEGAGDHNQMEWTTTNHFRVSWRRAGGGQACDFMTAAAISDTSSWHHIAFSVDSMDGSKTRMYVDGAPNIAPGPSVNGFPMDHTGSQWGLFANNNGAYAYDGEVAELWLALDRHVDFDDPASLAKFRGPDGKPVDLGTNGELPTGTPPTIYLSLRAADPASFFATNRGTGGDFTLHGTLEPSATSPSD